MPPVQIHLKLVDVEMTEQVGVSVRRFREIGLLKHREEQTFGQVPSTALSLDTDLEPGSKVKDLSITHVSGVYLFRGLGVNQLHSRLRFQMFHVQHDVQEREDCPVSLLELRM
jgi:hypothetical protein